MLEAERWANSEYFEFKQKKQLYRDQKDTSNYISKSVKERVSHEKAAYSPKRPMIESKEILEHDSMDSDKL